VFVTLIICLFMATPGFAGVIIYNNGAGSTNTTSLNDLFAFPISGAGWTSDTFTVASGGAILIDVDVAIWAATGTLVSSLNYCISTAVTCSGSGSQEIGAGTSLVADGSLGVSSGATAGYTLEEYTFALKGNAYTAGTYYLTLSGASATSYWDEYGGSTGTSSAQSSVVETPTNQSESFDIVAATPEPGSIALFGSGLMLLLAGFSRRARR
jgi:hypothetical protein